MLLSQTRGRTKPSKEPRGYLSSLHRLCTSTIADSYTYIATMSHSITRERTAPKNMDQLYQCSSFHRRSRAEVGGVE